MEPVVLALENEYAGKVEFVIVDLDTPEGKQLAVEYDVYYIPAFFFLDGTGKAVAKDVGYKSRQEMDTYLKNLLRAEEKRKRS
ncbi:hypothetical protein SY88_15155 [Clostridiales bacterium PH28_bin88]|nr:hypothetical protein SY88_15155 [Clostridiales bacterium PH28_bin88]